MFIRLRRKSRPGFTLVEILVATGLFTLAGLAMMTLYVFSIRSFMSLANYAELDQMNRTAMDKITAELRGAYYVVNVASNSITFVTTNVFSGGYESVTYLFNPPPVKTLVRTVNGVAGPPLLTDCSLVEFAVEQRTLITNSFNGYNVAIDDGSLDYWQKYVKAVRLTWKASKPILGGPGVSENVQTAHVVIRQQH